MGTSGVYIATTSTAFTSADVEGVVSGDSYVYDIDLVATPSFTLTGNFEPNFSVSESGYFHNYAGAAGSFSIDPSFGTFSYTITLAEAVAQGMTTVTFQVTGSDTGVPDTDTITFNFTLCFGAGTRIATATGEREVQSLAIGDTVLTADDRSVPVKWIGRTTIHPMFNPADRLEPVCIARGALGQGVPNRDLIVTPDHGLLIDGMVINAGALVGADGIDWYPWKAIGETLTYYHVETEDHDVILANGTPAETFIDYAGRRVFENFAEYQALYGSERTIREMPLPRISDQRLLPDPIRAWLGILPEPEYDFDTLSLRDAG